jgi:MFS transporter, FSR family, fosmidomycin resistance protein
MPPLLFRLVLLVSCAHALVHVYELAFSSVEQLVATDFHVGTATTGELARNFRLPFGLLAIVTGLLTDWLGARRMLIVYLAGSGLASLAISQSSSLYSLGWTLFLLGSFASIYHPAGLALISQQTSLANRPRALGLHGIFGSLGIGGAPFLAGSLLPLMHDSWRDYYLILTLPGILLAIVFILRLKPVVPDDAPQSSFQKESEPTAARDVHPEDHARWGSFALLTIFGALSGFIYAPFVTFLPRYIHGAKITIGSLSPSATWNFVSGLVLLLGMLGQYTAGRIAKPHALEPLLAKILFMNAPLLAWMAVAEGATRVLAAGLFALVHFMNQPVYNSLIASYTPRKWRSLAYGFSFMTSFGVGSLGPWAIGNIPSVQTGYYILAGVALSAALVAVVLAIINRPKVESAV